VYSKKLSLFFMLRKKKSMFCVALLWEPCVQLVTQNMTGFVPMSLPLSAKETAPGVELR